MGVSWKKAGDWKKRFGWYIGMFVTLGWLGGVGYYLHSFINKQDYDDIHVNIHPYMDSYSYSYWVDWVYADRYYDRD